MSGRDWRDRCAYGVMIAPNAAVGLTLAAMPPILPELARQLGSDSTAQFITSICGFGMIFGGFFSGRLLERLGIRAFSLLSLLLYGLCGTAGWLLESALALEFSRFALGMGGVFFSTAALALTAATFSGAARSRVIGLQQATSQVVNVCAVFIVGALVAVTGWRGAFLLYGAFALLLLAMTLIGVQDPPAPVSEVRNDPTPATPAIQFGRLIAPICALTTLMGILTVIPMAQLPFVLADNGQGSPQQVSLVLGINFVFAALSAVSFARLAARLRKPLTFLIGLICGMVGIAQMGFLHSLPAAWVAAALAGLGTGIYNTYVFDHGVEISPPAYHGRAAGLLFAFMFFGAAINPFVASAFAAAFGLHHALPVMAAIAVLCGLPVLLHSRSRPALPTSLR
jgi:MFS family permease